MGFFMPSEEAVTEIYNAAWVADDEDRKRLMQKAAEARVAAGLPPELPRNKIIETFRFLWHLPVILVAGWLGLIRLPKWRSKSESLSCLKHLVAEMLWGVLTSFAKHPRDKESQLSIGGVVMPMCAAYLNVPELATKTLAAEFTEWIKNKGVFTVGRNSLVYVPEGYIKFIVSPPEPEEPLDLTDTPKYRTRQFRKKV